MTEDRKDIVKWVVATVLVTATTVRWMTHAEMTTTDSIAHLVFILICLAFAFGKRFTDPAKEIVLIVLDVLPGGRRRYDPPTGEHPSRKPKIEPPPPGAGDV